MSPSDNAVQLALIVPRMPHPLLCPDASPAYAALAAGYAAARARIIAAKPDVLLIYSSGWASVIGHQIQANPDAKWTHVDPEFHELGAMPYHVHMDAELGAAWRDAALARGLQARTVSYQGFPFDTGSVVALKLLTEGLDIPASIVSSNMYADRAETVVLGKAAGEALAASGKRAVAIAVTNLSHWLHPRPVPPAEDRVSSRQDDEWNRKLLELLGQGRLEDVSQLARTFTHQAHADNKLKAIWWLATVAGAHNRYQGDVLAYGPVQGAGCAVVALTPDDTTAANLEFDEDDVEVFHGDRNVLATSTGDTVATPSPRPPASPPSPVAPAPQQDRVDVAADQAPRPVGAYPHARRVGELLYLSGVGPRQAGTDAIPGGPIRDGDGQPLDYDIRAQTRAVIENVRKILEASGSSLDRVLDVTSFLVDMDRDFAGYNEVYAELLGPVGPTRTTLAIRALPTPIAVELKVIAAAGPAR